MKLLCALAAPVMQPLERNGSLTGCVELSRTAIGVAIQAGAPCPDISTPGSLVKALLDARPVALTDPAAGGTAGIYLAKLMQRLGIAGAVRQKTLPGSGTV